MGNWGHAEVVVVQGAHAGQRAGGRLVRPSAQDDLSKYVGRPPPQETQTGDVSFYLGGDQLVWKENSDDKDTQGLGLFARYGHAHSDRNRISDYWSVGASYKGLFPSRDHDVTGVVVAQGILSEQYGDEVHPGADRETVYEWYYAYQLTPWCVISPDLQFVTNPGGDKDDRDAIVGGIRIRVTF